MKIANLASRIVNEVVGAVGVKRDLQWYKHELEKEKAIVAQELGDRQEIDRANLRAAELETEIRMRTYGGGENGG